MKVFHFLLAILLVGLMGACAQEQPSARAPAKKAAGTEDASGRDRDRGSTDDQDVVLDGDGDEPDQDGEDGGRDDEKIPPIGKAPEEGNPSEPALPFTDPTRPGPHKVSVYSEGLDSNAYRSAVIYYPEDTSQGPFPATTVSGGYTNTKEDMNWMGRHLASHGFVALVFTPTNNMTTNAAIWQAGHEGGIAKLKAEAVRQGAPIKGAVDLDNLGIMGFSMGGAGTILAANNLGAAIKATVPLCAYNPVRPNMSAATLFITGTRDTVASPTRVEAAFDGMPSSTPTAFAKFNGMTHTNVTEGGAHHDDIGRYAVAWYKLFLLGDERYRTFFVGEENERDKTGGTVFANPTDYEAKNL